MLKTKIDWADATWNPVTGCYKRCEYCYAERMVTRFGSNREDPSPVISGGYRLHDLAEPVTENGRGLPYPYGFEPTIHRYRMDQMARVSRPLTIFVGSMADLFGKWVPDSWIVDVFAACLRAKQHRYIFITKNPNRYIALAEKGLLPDDPCIWYGYTATRQADIWSFEHADACPCKQLLVSIEPILEPITPGFSTHAPADWVIIGAETGNRKNKVLTEAKWVKTITEECALSGIPVFHKGSLRKLMGIDFVQRYPWDI